MYANKIFNLKIDLRNVVLEINQSKLNVIDIIQINKHKEKNIGPKELNSHFLTTLIYDPKFFHGGKPSENDLLLLKRLIWDKNFDLARLVIQTPHIAQPMQYNLELLKVYMKILDKT